MNKKMAREIVESLPSLYPLMTADEEEAIWTVLATNSNTENDGDCISRQVAIDAFISHCYPIRYDYNSVENGMTITGIKQVLNELPSTQYQIIYCKDCKEYDPIYTGGAGVCGHWNAKTESNVYCAYAERKTE